jgi:tRNA (guanine37-N1)-methyltransferase
MIRFDILSVFPEMFASPFQFSLLKKAQERGLIEIGLHNIRDHAFDKHRMTDDTPYGGGCGMVMKVDPIDRALTAIKREKEASLVVLLTPQGEQFAQAMAAELATFSQIILICGHYEGVDERVRQYLVDREISIGDYVLTGGELSAMVVVDAVSRLIPGVLGNSESTASESFAMGLLEYPQYTRPAEYKDWKVPDVLVSGNHREIDLWRTRESLRRTLTRRPDLLRDATLSAEEKKILKSLTEEY